MWEMIEWLRCFPYTLYILMFCLVSLRESAAVRRANEVSDLPALRVKSHSSSCVDVFGCRAISLSAYDSPHITRLEEGAWILIML